MMVWSLASASEKTRASFLIGFGVLVAAAAIALFVLAVTLQHIAFWIVAPLIAVVAITMLVAGARMIIDARRIERAGDLLPVAPRSAAGDPRPLTWQQLAGDIAARFDGTPHGVAASDARIRVTADLADASFLAPGAAVKVHHLYFTDVERKGDRVRIVSSARDVEARAGIGDDVQLTAKGSVRGRRGLVLWRSRRIEYGTDAQGFGRKVDVDFASGSVTGPVKAAVKEARWRTVLGPEVKGALITAGIALLAVPLVPLMLWLQSIGVVPE